MGRGSHAIFGNAATQSSGFICLLQSASRTGGGVGGGGAGETRAGVDASKQQVADVIINWVLLILSSLTAKAAAPPTVACSRKKIHSSSDVLRSGSSRGKVRKTGW